MYSFSLQSLDIFIEHVYKHMTTHYCTSKETGQCFINEPVDEISEIPNNSCSHCYGYFVLLSISVCHSTDHVKHLVEFVFVVIARVPFLYIMYSW